MSMLYTTMTMILKKPDRPMIIFRILKRLQRQKRACVMTSVPYLHQC
jgi:hypothetical protein